MTTSFSHFVRGHFLSALQANPAGLVLASVMALLIPWSLKSLQSGHFWLTSDPMMSAALMAVSLSAVVLIVWSLKMVNWVYLAFEDFPFESWC